MNVGCILEPYDSDKSFPVFGFGGIPRHLGQNSTNHCFAMNGNRGDPNINGVANIVMTYKATLPQIGLGGPTLFGPLLTEFKNYVMSVLASRTYPVLLLLTDGVIHDMPATRDLICELSYLPCSVIIVGVGNANFDAMEELDGDGGRLTNMRGEPCIRDIVQFVRYNQAVMQGDLAGQVLKEVPSQLVSYMEYKGESAKPVEQVLQ